MATSLKTQNKIALWTIVAANLTVYAGVVKRQSLSTADWLDALQSAGELIPIGLALVVVGIANGLIPADWKARLIFWRWRNPLPGCEAFTRHAKNDPRIDIAALTDRAGPLPTDPVDQNRLWYKLYRKVANEEPVSQVHTEFLFARDYACLSVMMFAALGIAAVFQIEPWGVALAYLTIPLAQYLFATIAARNHGCRFVQTVLAITCTQEKGSDR